MLSLIKWTLLNKANLLIQRMLQLHEVVKYFNVNDIHFSNVVYTYQFFYNKLVHTDVYNATYNYEQRLQFKHRWFTYPRSTVNMWVVS